MKEYAIINVRATEDRLNAASVKAVGVANSYADTQVAIQTLRGLLSTKRRVY